MLEIKNLYCGYDNMDVIKDLSLTVRDGENLSIIGPNGCGKTTLLRAISSLMPYKGSVKIDGMEVSSIKRRDLAKKVAIMTQTSQIYFPYTVFETVAFGRYAHIQGAFSKMSKDDEDKVLGCIQDVNLLDYKDKRITELSGGQLQRVYLARTFAQDPDIILLDEPTNHLDLKSQIEMLQHVNEWTSNNKKTVIGVFHDLNLVQMFSKDLVLMNKGRIEASGDVQEVLKNKCLQSVYGIDIKKFMIEALEKWK